VITLAIEQVEHAVFLQNFEVEKKKNTLLVLETKFMAFHKKRWHYVLVVEIPHLGLSIL
jgi:hypothetical protein